MKWISLVAALAASALLPTLFRLRPSYAVWVWTAFGVLPFLIYPLHLYMALRSWAFWPGYVKGIEFSLLDVLAIGLLFTLPPRPNFRLKFKIPMFLYAAAVLLSCFNSESFEISFGYLFQLTRMFLIYALVEKASFYPHISRAILRGFAIGIGVEVGFALFQRFILGELQVTGTFGHQNSLGMVTHFVAFPYFAMFIEQKRKWIGVPLAVIMGCALVAILTVSRATIGLAAIGFVTVFAVLAARNWSRRKAIIALVGVVGIFCLTPIVLGSMAERNLTNENGYDERQAFENAASSILSDNPLGIGANHYVVVANTKGYNQAAGVVPTANSLSAHVHNVYYLVAAETGWPGIVAWLLLLIVTVGYGLVSSQRLKNSIQGSLLLGLCVSFLITYLHSLYEWVFITWSLQYFAAIGLGLIVGISRQKSEYRFRQENSQVKVPAHLTISCLATRVVRAQRSKLFR